MTDVPRGAPDAEAFAFAGGRVVWVGSAAEARERARDGARTGDILDAAGRTVLPGLVDAHMHPLSLADALAGVPCLPPRVTSLEQILAAVAERAARLPEGAWIVGAGWDEARLAEGRPPTRADLDRAAPRHPVVLFRACGHIVAANSRALALGGVSRETADPPGGAIARDAAGEPNGILKERAAALVTRHLPLRDARAVADALAVASRNLVEHGITTVADMAVADDGDDEWGGYRLAVRSGRFRPRAFLYHVAHQLQAVLAGRGEGGRYADEPGRLRLAGFKLFADGSVSGRTAAMATPYEGGADTGILTLAPEELEERVAAVHHAGYAVSVHAMGDRAIDLAARAIAAAVEGRGGVAAVPAATAGTRTAEARSADPRQAVARPRHRIEHAPFVSEEALGIILRLGIVLVPQPIFLFAEGGSYLANVGRARTETAYPLRSWLGAGVRFAVSSDAPSTAWDDPAHPWLGLYAAATRRLWDGTPLGEAETIPIAEALHAYTSRAAFALGAEDEVGTLAPGRRADFIVLEEDPLEVPVERLPGLRPRATFMDGEPVAGDGAALRAAGG